MESFADDARRMFASFEAKDLPAVMGYFAADAVVIDPHYPQVEMRGAAAIARGFGWAFGNIERPGLTVRRAWSEDGQSGAVEVATHHLFRGGMRVAFPQVFVVERRDGLITLLQAYPAYGPPGLPGLITRLTRFAWKRRGRI